MTFFILFVASAPRRLVGLGAGLVGLGAGGKELFYDLFYAIRRGVSKNAMLAKPQTSHPNPTRKVRRHASSQAPPKMFAATRPP